MTYFNRFTTLLAMNVKTLSSFNYCMRQITNISDALSIVRDSGTTENQMARQLSVRETQQYAIKRLMKQLELILAETSSDMQEAVLILADAIYECLRTQGIDERA
jgi:hypothetical protein